MTITSTTAAVHVAFVDWTGIYAYVQVLTKEEPGMWPKLSPNMQVAVKQQLLEGMKAEKNRSINKKART